jgi:hypothetical protein
MSGATAWLRRAGRLDAGGGESILWSVAEGRRGRRWRSLRLDAHGRVVSDVLLEVDPDGRWARLELATAAGILTLHPEPGERAVRGNIVTGRGVVPLAFAWSPAHLLVVTGEPVADAALAARRPPAAPGPGLIVGSDLGVTVADAIDPAMAPPDGLPGPSWPLEA